MYPELHWTVRGSSSELYIADTFIIMPLSGLRPKVVHNLVNHLSNKLWNGSSRPVKIFQNHIAQPKTVRLIEGLLVNVYYQV